MDVQETRRAVSAIGIVGQINGRDVIYRDSAIEIVQRRERELQALTDALWKACGDDSTVVEAYLAAERAST